MKSAARALGFDAVGICDLRPIERDALAGWLAAGHAGSMTYMQRQAARRKEPQRIAPAAQRAVVVLKNYYRSAPEPSAAARVARYAWGEDYHAVVGDQLRALSDRLIELGSRQECTRWYVDAGPVPERELAQRAGLGWIAKNTMLIHPEVGSFTFIGTVFSDLDIAVDEPFATDHCGSCTRCLEACPTNALIDAHVLDARRCISYLTIEHRGAFAAEQGTMIGDWLFGCDICQDVCPWNCKFAPDHDEPRFTARPQITTPDLEQLAAIDDARFAEAYSDTAFERPGAAGLARNAAQVLRNRRLPARDE